MNVAFVLVSYRRDAPAGMERSVAALCEGLRALGHEATILSADPAADGEQHVAVLHTLGVDFPCDDETLRAAVDGNRRLGAEVARILEALNADVVCYVDALWGLGLTSSMSRVRRALMVHVVGHREDLRTALGHRPEVVLVPSRTVLEEAAAEGWDTTRWTVIPNALLKVEPPAPDAGRRQLRLEGPIRIIARLGSEKGVLDLLRAAPERGRHTEVAIASASFERDRGSQEQLMAHCRVCADSLGWMRLRAGLSWNEVPQWLAGAAVAVVPSYRETFGLVALEAMSVGTPVVARAVGNLPDLVGSAGTLVIPSAGDTALWEAVPDLTADVARYERASAVGIERSRAYHPVDVARRWIEAVIG